LAQTRQVCTVFVFVSVDFSKNKNHRRLCRSFSLLHCTYNSSGSRRQQPTIFFGGCHFLLKCAGGTIASSANPLCRQNKGAAGGLAQLPP
jgi:hypothetical protein